jgi:hypothetical protein
MVFPDGRFGQGRHVACLVGHHAARLPWKDHRPVSYLQLLTQNIAGSRIFINSPDYFFAIQLLFEESSVDKNSMMTWTLKELAFFRRKYAKAMNVCHRLCPIPANRPIRGMGAIRAKLYYSEIDEYITH